VSVSAAQALYVRAECFGVAVQFDGWVQPTTRRSFVASAAAATATARATGALAKKSKSTSKVTSLPDAASVAAKHSHPADLSVVEAASLLQARKLSATELLAACQERIAKRNGGAPTFDGADGAVNAWVRLYPEVAAKHAAEADERLSAKEVKRRKRRAPLLCGIPVGLKDLYAVKGLGLTASSHVLEGNVAGGDASVWTRLRNAGMVLVGHTHTHEFALGISTDQTGNPWDLTLSAGGSSGGSAAALAARMVPATLGTDTAGSLRIPSSVCGTTTIKPTIGLVSTHGVIPAAWSLDHCGPMARSAADCALLLSYMAGPDIDDPATLALQAPPSLYPLRPRKGDKPLNGVRLGVPRVIITAGTPEDGVLKSFEQMLTECRELGATVLDVTLPAAASDLLVAVQSLQAPENLAYHAQFESKSASYRPSTLEHLQFNRAFGATAVAYLAAQQARTDMIHGVNAVFADKKLDALVMPTTPVPAQERGQGDLLFTAGGPVATYTPWWAICGLPVVSLPGPLTADKHLPIGISFIGLAGGEAPLLQLTIDHQTRYPHHDAQPPGLA